MNDAVKIRIALHGTLYLSGDTLEDYVHFSVVHPMCMSASPGHAHGRHRIRVQVSTHRCSLRTSVLLMDLPRLSFLLLNKNDADVHGIAWCLVGPWKERFTQNKRGRRRRKYKDMLLFVPDLIGHRMVC